MLRGLILKDSPVAKEEEYRIEIIMNLRNLERLDKDIFTDEERQEAQQVRNRNEDVYFVGFLLKSQHLDLTGF